MNECDFRQLVASMRAHQKEYFERAVKKRCLLLKRQSAR